MMCIKQHLRAFLVHWVTFWVSLGPFRVTQPNAPPPGHLDEAHARANRALMGANSGELRSGSSGMAASMIFKVSDLAGLSVGRRRVTRDSLRARVGSAQRPNGLPACEEPE